MGPNFINHSLLDALQTPFFVVNAKLEVIYCNNALLSLNKEKMQAISMLSEGVTLQAPTSEPVVKALVTQQVAEQDIVWCNPDATMSAFHLKATPVIEDGATYVAVSTLDITSKQGREKSESVFFHDIINLAGSMAGYMEVIQDLPSEEIINHLPSIKKIADQLVDDIVCQRKVVRAEEDRLEAEINSIDLTSLLHDLHAFIESQAFSRGREFSSHTLNSAHTLYTDERMLKRTLLILLQYAAEKTSRGEKYALSVSTTDQSTVFAIRHNNVACKQDDLHLFKQGHLSEGYTDKTSTYQAKLLAHKGLNGTIEVEVSENGTDFLLSIPTIHPLADKEDIENGYY